MISEAICSAPFLAGQLLDWPARVYGEKPALEWEGGRLTFAQMREAVTQRSAVIESLGAGKGQRWGLLLGNSPDFVVSLFALFRLGCVAVPLRCNLPGEKLEAHVELTRLDGVLTCPEMQGSLNGMSRWRPAPAPAGPGLVAFVARELRRPDTLAPVDLDPALILLTSGSTGRSRGAVLQHHAVLANLRSNIQALGLRDDDRTLVVLPLTHAYALIHQCLCHLMIGATVCLAPSPMVGALMHRYLESFAVTTLSTAPPVLRVLVAGLGRSRCALPSLRLVTVGAAFADRETVTDFLALLPQVRLAVTYGLTEAGPRVATHFVSREGPFNPECVGAPLPNVAAGLRDLGDGRSEIFLRSRSAMCGYAEAEDDAIYGAGLPTGDTGDIQEGRIHLKGRAGRVINRGGILVGAEQVESVLLAHPAVASVRVEAEPHAFWGEVPVATLVLNAGHESTGEDQFKEYCAARLSLEERPARYVFQPAAGGETGKTGEMTSLLKR